MSSTPDAPTTLAVPALGTFLSLMVCTAPLDTIHATATSLAPGVARRTWVLSSIRVGLATALLVAGAQDALIPTENTFTVEGPNVSQLLLSDAGHMGMIEQPNVTGERISAFVRFVSTL